MTMSCRKDEPPCIICPPLYVQHIFLDTLIVDPTEVWLRVHTNDSTRTGLVQLYRDSDEILAKTIETTDTTIIDNGLSPTTIHSYRLYRLQSGAKIDSSALMVVRTMDTTSHNFTWQLDTLGDGNGSVLNDVAIINDSLTYAVGQISTRDSTGNWITYNVAKWNGLTWELQQIAVPICGTNSTATFPLYCVFGFSADDIWFSGGGDMEHWDGFQFGVDCSMNSLISGTIVKIWGTSSHNLFAVGRNGTIIHFDGSTWTRMDSGTDVDLLDVWGSPDGSVVWACGFYHSKLGTYLWRYDGIKWTAAYDGSGHETIILADSLSGAYSSLYTSTPKRIYVASDAGVYLATENTRGEAKRLSFTSTFFPGFPNRVRGNGSNDLVIVGYYNMIAHYNGANWQYYQQFYQQDQHLFSVDEKGNLVVAVGEIYDPINPRGLVFIGRR